MSFDDLHTCSTIFQLVTWKTLWIKLMDKRKLSNIFVDDLTLASVGTILKLIQPNMMKEQQNNNNLLGI